MSKLASFPPVHLMTLSPTSSRPTSLTDGFQSPTSTCTGTNSECVNSPLPLFYQRSSDSLASSSPKGGAEVHLEDFPPKHWSRVRTSLLWLIVVIAISLTLAFGHRVVDMTALSSVNSECTAPSCGLRLLSRNLATLELDSQPSTNAGGYMQDAMYGVVALFFLVMSVAVFVFLRKCCRHGRRLNFSVDLNIGFSRTRNALGDREEDIPLSHRNALAIQSSGVRTAPNARP